MARFETHRKRRDAFRDEGSEAVTSESGTRADVLALRSDLDVLRAEIRGDMYRALWIQAGFVVTVNAGVVTAIVAIATAFG